MDRLAAKFFSSVCNVPVRIGVFSKTSHAKISSRLSRAGFPSVDGERYLSGGTAVSMALSLLIFALSLAVLPVLESIAVFLISFGVLLSFFFLLPSLLAKRRMALAESELPFLLREAAVYLDIGLPFEKVVAKLSARNYAFSHDFLLVSQEIKSGATVPAAIAGMAARSGSLSVKRCLMLLSSLYETGGGTEPIKRTAEELAASQLSGMRLQSGRLSLIAILFICCSALLPSFFTVFVSVSPSMSTEVSSWQVWLAFLIVFPALNLAALLLVLLLLPPNSAQAISGSDLLGEFLKKSGFPHGSKAFALFLAVPSVALAILFFLYGQPAISALSICLAPAAYAAASYLASKEIGEAEAHLPDALYAAASTHKLLSSEKMLLFLSKGEFGRLSESFGLALRRQKAGDSFAKSMAAAFAYCPSPLVERAFSLLTVSYETGANMYFALREAAQDVVSFFTLVRERSSQLAIQRYTILAASALLVPLILGTVVSLAPVLSSASSLGWQSGTGAVSSLQPACTVYLAINCLLSSILLALSETNPKRAALYFALIAPFSQIVFFFSSKGSALLP